MKWWITLWTLLSGLIICILYLFRNMDKDTDKIRSCGNILLLTIVVILGVLVFN